MSAEKAYTFRRQCERTEVLWLEHGRTLIKEEIDSEECPPDNEMPLHSEQITIQVIKEDEADDDDICEEKTHEIKNKTLVLVIIMKIVCILWKVYLGMVYKLFIERLEKIGNHYFMLANHY